MSMRGAMRRVFAAILPWPARRERKAAIAAANAQAEQARRRAERDRAITADLERMRTSDPIAAIIAEQLRGGRQT